MSEFDPFKGHFSQQISKSLEKYVTETVFKESRYLFIQSVKGVQIAYCTHCNKKHVTKERLKHKQEDQAICPHCRSKCQVRAAGISRRYMEDKAVLVWYERSKKNPNAITARVLSVYRDYSGDFQNVQTKYNCSHMYLFEPGESYYFQLGAGSWKRRSTTYSAFDNHFAGWGSYRRYRSDANIKQAVKGTPFQYSTWESYLRFQNPSYITDMVEFFDLAARYPCVEYLTKSGFGCFIHAKLHGYSTYGAVNWRGKTLEKVLRLSRAELREVRDLGIEPTPQRLAFYQKQRKKGHKLSIKDAFLLAEILGSYYEEYYKGMLKLAPEKKILNYMLKQLRKGSYSSAGDLLIDWRDYQKECKELGIDLTEEHHLFPNDLRESHMKTTRKIRVKTDLKINRKIAKRLKDLEMFSFEHGGLMIRPARSAFELFQEGKLLKHCVGGYAERYASGTTSIFVVRKCDEPNKPFFTMEVVGTKIMQCRGFKNCSMTKEVEAFVQKFKAQKLEGKKAGGRSAQRQEAVV